VKALVSSWASTGETMNLQRNWRPKSRWKANIKMDLKQIVCKDCGRQKWLRIISNYGLGITEISTAKK
jgi:hypothetical protein